MNYRVTLLFVVCAIARTAYGIPITLCGKHVDETIKAVCQTRGGVRAVPSSASTPDIAGVFHQGIHTKCCRYEGCDWDDLVALCARKEEYEAAPIIAAYNGQILKAHLPYGRYSLYSKLTPDILMYNDKLNAMPSMSEHLEQLQSQENRFRKYNSKKALSTTQSYIGTILDD